MVIGAAYVAHELRTPVALQLALAEATLADPRADEVAWRTMAEGVIASCEHQGRLIDALLDLACSQHRLTRVEPVDLAALAREVSNGGCARGLRLFGRPLIATLEPAVVAGDPVLLERLVANLVSNAIRHNIPDGRIEVSTRATSGHAVLSVANTGPVVPPCELGRLFQPFERLGSQPRRCTDGVGLGLTIVKSIADAHNAIVAARAPATGGLEIEVSFRV